MSEEYTLKRISYVQIQLPDVNSPAVIFYTIRPYRLEGEAIVDAPVSFERSYLHLVSTGEMGMPCQDFNNYLISLVED